MATKKKRSKKASQDKLDFNDERVRKIGAIICFLIAIYLAIAFISYLYTWKVDQDKVLKYSWTVLFESNITVENWLGRLGALISTMFFYWGFGLPSMVFIFLLCGLGIDLWKENPLKYFLSKVKYSVAGMAFISLFLEFIFRQSEFTWGGAFGQSTCLWLINFVGSIGLVLLLLFILITSTIWIFNPTWQMLQFTTADINTPDTINSIIKKFIGHTASRNSKEIMNTSREVAKEIETLRPFQPNEAHNERSIPKTKVAEGIQEDSNGLFEFRLPEKPAVKSKKQAYKPPTELEINEPAPVVQLDTTDPVPFDNIVKKESAAPEVKGMLHVEEDNKDHTEPYDPTADLSQYKYPDLKILNTYENQDISIDRAELENNKDQIIKTLLDYKIEITKIRATIGPTVTLYEIVPAPGVKISKIKNLEDDIALSLAALGIRIIAPIPGKGTIGIEVPNKNPQMVGLKEVLNSDKFKNAKMDLPIALGKTISNEVFVADLAKMPHLLIAGATGQGKSVGINTILMSLLYKKHPSQVKLVLIDPKKVELFPYSRLDQHFLGFLPNEEEPIVTETNKVVYTLNSLCLEMDERYDLLKAARSRNIKEYNDKFTKRKLNPNKGHRFLPYIVLVIDEFADLIMTAGKEVEMPIARLAQLARAIGIHLIIATQRPSVNIITGIIKANFPARIAFKVTSKIDSRTILDTGGADQLIGKGDMILSIGSSNIRLQCAFVDTPEVEDVINGIGDQQGFPEPFYLPEVKSDDDTIEGSGMKLADLDVLFEDAAKLIVSSQSGSTSMLQRKMQLGYNRAGRIMDQMEALGIVGPTNGSKPREVLVYGEQELFAFLDNLKTK